MQTHKTSKSRFELRNQVLIENLKSSNESIQNLNNKIEKDKQIHSQIKKNYNKKVGVNDKHVESDLKNANFNE